jgi:hypothetical protein
MLGKSLKIFSFIIGAPALILALAILHNNIGDSDYSQVELNNAFNQSVNWLQQNNLTIQNEDNSMLWWMLIQAASIQHNETLDAIIAQYKTKNAARYENSAWSYLITGQSNPNIGIYSLGNPADYNIHFVYGFSCSRSLADEDIVKIQNQTDFCWRHHPVSPACTTHQLMAFRFMQRTGCEDQKFVADSITTLTGYIKQQSTYDFRMVDVYLQRVLMQIDSGHKENINPRWVKRILQNQYADGGWGGFQPLVPVGGGKYFGFHTKGVGIRKLESSFHSTAQGVWLMALLMNQPAQ